MHFRWLKQWYGKPTGLLRGPTLAVLVLAAAACSAEATATPAPAPAAVPTAAPTPAAESTAKPEAGSVAFANYWNPPTEHYGQPVYGGTLRISYEDPLEHANVWGAATDAADRYRGPTGATLVMENPYDPGAPVIPDLAKNWRVHDGLDGVTFHFREGTTWHNGEPFVCEDARFSFETMITETGITASYMKSRLSHVVLEEMSCLDDMTLRMNFRGPTGTPLLNLSNHRALVFNKAWFQAGGEEAMFKDVSRGIGPFKWAAGQTVGNDEQRFYKNPGYFIPGLPYVDVLVIFGILDDSARQAAMLSHQIDWLWVYGRNNNWKQYQAYVDHDQIMTAIGPSRSSLRLKFNAWRRPFDNVRVRQAIIMSIDRNLAIQILKDGHGIIGGFGYAPGSPWELHQEKLCTVPGWCLSDDIEAARIEARAILEAEGFEFDKTYVLAPEQTAAAFLQGQLGLLGMKFEPPDPFWDPCPRCIENPYDLWISSSFVDSDDPDAGVAPFLRCDSLRKNQTPGLCDDSIVILLDEAQTETNPEKRLALAHRIELALMSQYNRFPIYWEQEAAAFWPNARGYTHSPSPTGSYSKFMHMWTDQAHKDDSGSAGQTTGVPGGM